MHVTALVEKHVTIKVENAPIESITLFTQWGRITLWDLF